MKKYLLNIALLATLLSFVACDSDNNQPVDENSEIKEFIKDVITTRKETAVYVINEENSFDGKNSKLTFYSKDKGTVIGDIFKIQNNDPMGVGAQDLLVYGNKMYITATNSDNIYITDLEAKQLKYSDGTPAKIDSQKEGNGLKEPRSLIAHGDYVYASYYSGHVAKIDTASMKVVKTISDNYTFLEEMTIVGNKLYVTESRDPNNRLAVIDLNKFEFETPLTVSTNPYHIVSDASNNIFILSLVYDANWASTTTFTQIKADGTKAEQVYNASEMALLNNKILFICSGISEDGAQTRQFTYYDINKGEFSENSFIAMDNKANDKLTEKEKEIRKELNLAYKISVDPANQDIYISTTDYKNEGSMFIFSSTGEYKTHFKTKGISPSKARFTVSKK